MAKLFGKTALVTGAARGLGRAYALRLADLGANVGVIDINLHSYKEYREEQATMSADSVIDELKSKGVKAAGAEADLTDPKAVNRSLQEIVSSIGEITILVANAGGGGGSIMANRPSEIQTAELEQIIKWNLHATVHTANSVIPYMKKNKRGKIVTVASTAALRVSPGGFNAAYALSKDAIIMYTKYLAKELAPEGINVNCIAPGFMSTGKAQTAWRDFDMSAMMKQIPIGRVGVPEDCAKVIEFLTTDLSDYVTGTVIPVDGGLVL